MAKKHEEQEISQVRVTFVDGEVKEYLITASPSISRFLAQDAGQNGILTLYNKDQAYSIPVAQIREWSIDRYLPAPN